MFGSIFFGALLLGVVSARSIDLVLDDEGNVYLPYLIVEEQGEDFHHPLQRMRRDTGKVIFNPDGGAVLSGKAPLAGNGENTLSAIGIAGAQHGKAQQTGFGLALDNVNGHGVSLLKETLPGADRYTGAGTLNLLPNSDDHHLSANAFVANTRPSHSSIPDFNTYGGGLGYNYKEKVGASVGMASTPFLGRNEYNVGATANLFKTPSSSLDFGAGLRRVQTPHFDTGFEPNFGFTYGLRW